MTRRTDAAAAPIAQAIAIALAGVVCSAPVAAQDDMSEVEIRREHVAGTVHVLYGRGGNIGVATGPDGIILVDDQYAPLTPKIRTAVAAISEAPLRFVINTHWHGDHTGGNEALGKAGATIVAHDAVYTRLSSDQVMMFLGNERKVGAKPPEAWPVITFNETLSFHINGETVRAHHVPHAHTDGDSLIHFPASNVIHMGDTYFAGGYPFIDLSSGGSLQGIIAAVETARDLADGDTRFIPGHGKVGTRADLDRYLAMLTTARDRVQALIDQGLTLEQIQSRRPLEDYDADWGQGFIEPDAFLSFIYVSLT